MSFEYIIEKDNSVKKLSNIDENNLVKKISENFTAYNDKRATNLEKSNALININRNQLTSMGSEIFFKYDSSKQQQLTNVWFKVGNDYYFINSTYERYL